MKKTLKLAAAATGIYLAAGAVTKIRELQEQAHDLTIRIRANERRIGKLYRLDLDLFVLNAPNRLRSVETRAEAIAASHDSLSRAVATLEERVEDLTAPRVADPEDVTT